jgi:hypothetical protein
VWLATTRGFYSAVLWDDGRICVRARAKGDLVRLRELVPGFTKVKKSKRADYRYRVWCSPQTWATACAALAAEVEYPNFKNAVAKSDPERSRLYHHVWGTLLGIRERLTPEERAKKDRELRRQPRSTRYHVDLPDETDDPRVCVACGNVGLLDSHTGWRVCDEETCERWGEAYFGGFTIEPTARRWDDDLDLDAMVLSS